MGTAAPANREGEESAEECVRNGPPGTAFGASTERRCVEPTRTRTHGRPRVGPRALSSKRRRGGSAAPDRRCSGECDLCAFGACKSWTRQKRVYGPTVFQTVVPEASAFKVSLACRQPVSHYAPRSKAARVTHQLTQEIFARIKVRTREEKIA